MMSYHKPTGELVGILAYVTYLHFNDFESLFNMQVPVPSMSYF